MSRLEKQIEENLRKIDLMEKQFENEKMARLRESTEYDTRLDEIQMQIAQLHIDTENAHEVSATRLTELSDSLVNFRQTQHEHFEMLRDRLDECNGALYQSVEHQRVVCSVVGELMEKSDVHR